MINHSIDLNVKLCHTSLIWPLQLETRTDDATESRHWEIFESIKTPCWQKRDDEFTADSANFKERHYREFVSFLPYVQRFLYGEGRQTHKRKTSGDSPIHVYRRKDVATLRVTLSPDSAPILLSLVHLDLYFFHDLDLAILNVEVRANDLPLSKVREFLFRFGRAYPSGWDEQGAALHTAYLVEWLDVNGGIVATSDTQRRSKFLAYACEHRTPCISEHWAYLLRPMALSNSEENGKIRYRLIEYHRMPAMVYLAMQQPRSLSPEDWARIGLATTLSPSEPLPTHDATIQEFTERYCYDRFWFNSEAGPNTRIVVTGNSLTLVGDSNNAIFLDAERGALAQFRHQYFLVFLIAHLHRAALLVFSDVLVDSVNALQVRNDKSVRRFKRQIRANFEIFLRFTHRYWFHQISERPQVQAVFNMTAKHLGNDALYEEVRDEIREMSHYLDSDSQRRQSNTVVRLTVITILGLIATVTTGYFGMNIIAFGEGSIAMRLAHGVIATAIFVSMVILAIVRARRLSDFIEALADDKMSIKRKFKAFWRVFYQRKGAEPD